MVKLDEIQKRLLMEVADLHAVPEGAYIAPIEHRRELDHHSLGFRQQLIDNLEYVGRTVSNAVCAPSMFITTGRIDKYQVGRWHRMQIVHPVAIHHLYLMKPQKLEILR